VNKRLAEIRAGIDQPTGESPKSLKVEIIGIGARLIDENGSCIIAELIPGGPAEKSQQLEPKDVILGVSKSDGTLADISDMKLSEIVELIKGPKNSKVKLIIQPFKNPSTPKVVSIKRKPFHIYHQTHENKVSEKAGPVPSDTPSGKKLIVHIVKRGDTVKSIAKKYGSRVKWILNANQLTDPKKIKVGEKISVPQKKTMTK
jgi:LysM repeat protein